MKTKPYIKSILLLLPFIGFFEIKAQAVQDTVHLDSAYLMKEMGDFFDLLKKPKPKPILYLEMYGGVNYGLIDRQNDYYDFWNHHNPQGTNFWDMDYLIGLNANFIASKQFEFGLGLDYSRITSSAQTPWSSGSLISQTSVSETMQWLSIPITCKFRFIRESRIGAYALTGFTSSILLKSELDGYRVATSPVEVSGLDYTRLRKKWMGSLTVGVGFEYLTYGNGFFIESRYEHGLGDRTIAENRYSDQAILFDLGYIEPTTYLRNFSFRLGYKWLIKKKPEEI